MACREKSTRKANASWPATKKTIVVKQGHRPAQERAGEDADGGQDHGLEPDAEEPLHVVEAEVPRASQQVQVAFGHPQVLRRAQAADLDPQARRPSRPGSTAGSGTRLV